MIYEFKTSLTVSGGSASTFTLKVIHGLLRNVFVQALTDTTVFRVSLQDEDSISRQDYGFARGMVNDNLIQYPIVGQYSVNIANASRDDTFRVRLGIEE